MKKIILILYKKCQEIVCSFISWHRYLEHLDAVPYSIVCFYLSIGLLLLFISIKNLKEKHLFLGIGV
ncbi:hypothetical protein, partial [Bacillus thuringiensis]|uniref:hypothetical protein n=1 Tax=Bacillus thuringiensis TaxID=1428 RepID=UPI001C9312B3